MEIVKKELNGEYPLVLLFKLLVVLRRGSIRNGTELGGLQMAKKKRPSTKKMVEIRPTIGKSKNEFYIAALALSERTRPGLANRALTGPIG